MDKVSLRCWTWKLLPVDSAENHFKQISPGFALALLIRWLENMEKYKTFALFKLFEQRLLVSEKQNQTQKAMARERTLKKTISTVDTLGKCSSWNNSKEKAIRKISQKTFFCSVLCVNRENQKKKVFLFQGSTLLSSVWSLSLLLFINVVFRTRFN